MSDENLNTPTVTFQSLTFSDGTSIALEPTDVVVFVGPNNVGKSVALRKLEESLGGLREKIVIHSVELRKTGTPEEFTTFLDKNVVIKPQGQNRNFSAYRLNFSMGGNADPVWPRDFHIFHSLFCMRIPTETRITDSNPANTFTSLEQPASHPIHMLYDDECLENKISQYFRRAFGEDLILDRLGGNKIPLRVGGRRHPAQGEDRVSKTYIERLRDSTKLLQEQGDGMRSFASVILYLLAPTTPSILLFDEPEAFLHPPQARLLGEIIAKEKSSRAQLFVATHSPDVLHGLVNVAPDHLRLLRIQRDGNINHIKELDKGHVRKISADPLMKYSSVMSGVFHERVIICESDADCMFYSSLLDLQEVHGGRQPDVFFVHANGKHRMAMLAEALVALDVPVDIIADIDVLNDMGVLKTVIEALNGDWRTVEPVATAVKKAIEEHKPWLSFDEIRKGIQGMINTPLSGDDSVKKLYSRIKAVFSQASPWDAIKNAGKSALPPGQATQQFQKLEELCRQSGLWIVPVGEMEGFCKSVGAHGPGWVQQVIEQKELANDPDLGDARNFVREIWTSRAELSGVHGGQ